MAAKFMFKLIFQFH